MISKHLDKNNFHHAYLIEGTRDEIVPEIIKFCESINIKIFGNPDFFNISIDNFKIDEAFDLRSMSTNKGFSYSKKIFVIYINSISLDAQNVLLKMFEEPIENTHFFLITPDTNALLKTFISRFYFISDSSFKQGLGEETKEAEKFTAMSLKDRIDFIKNLLTIPKEEEDEVASLDSARSKALKFLNALESVVVSRTVFDKNVPRTVLDTFQHFFKVREFLRMPGSSVKSLMESIAFIVPDVQRLEVA